MSKTFKNWDALETSILNRTKKALEKTQIEINAILQKHIDLYYDEYDPIVYERQNILKDMSIVEIKVNKLKKGFSTTIGFSEDYLNYRYPGVPTLSGNLPATGFDIINWNNEDGSHGGIIGGSVRIWSDFLEEVGDEFGMLSILYNNLKNEGLNLY